ncbi:MAG: glycosyltransferase [Candidatus Falkowbacteria bacterium]|nr:glycosyltransferase [Candidatus Falkowbacteria bacterium]
MIWINFIPMVMTLHDYKIICPNYQLFSNGKTCTDCAGGKYYNCLLKKCSKNSYAKSFLAMAEAYLHNTFLKTYDQVDLFIAPCQYLKDMCVRFGVPENKITTLYNFTEAPALPKELDTGISVSDKISDQPYFLFFGRISEEKGINVLFEAFKKNNKSLIIIGTGPEFKKYQAQIDNERIGNIKMIGPKYGKDLQNIIANAEAILIPSIWPENNPLTMLETMAMGKPVIASHTGGIPEIIKHQENGLLFEMGNAEDLILKINELNTTNLEVLGQKAKETISSLNKENYYQNIVNIYNKLKKY